MPCKHGTLVQCQINVGPPSTMLAQHWPYIGSVPHARVLGRVAESHRPMLNSGHLLADTPTTIILRRGHDDWLDQSNGHPTPLLQHQMIELLDFYLLNFWSASISSIWLDWFQIIRCCRNSMRHTYSRTRVSSMYWCILYCANFQQFL